MSLRIQGKIGQRGQVVIPKPIRDALNLRSGTVVNFRVEGDEVVVSAPDGTLDEFLDAVEKVPEPAAVDWDDQYYTQLEG